MKYIFITSSFFLISLFSFSQKRDTINLFEKNKKVNKDAVKEIQAAPQQTQASVYYIKYGKSSTPCSGYCIIESTVDSVKIIKTSKPLKDDKNYPAKTENAQTTGAQWNSLINSVDMTSFFSIPEKIGNPGGGDGEAEWIEINYSGKVHKISFDSTGPDEYEGIKNLLLFLKAITSF